MLGLPLMIEVDDREEGGGRSTRLPLASADTRLKPLPQPCSAVFGVEGVVCLDMLLSYFVLFIMRGNRLCVVLDYIRFAFCEEHVYLQV